jgi:hypothetical protein
MIEDEKLELRCVELCGVVGKMISNLVLRGLNLTPGGGGGGRDRGRNQCDDTLIPDSAINYQDRWYFKSRFVTLESESSSRITAGREMVFVHKGATLPFGGPGSYNAFQAMGTLDWNAEDYFQDLCKRHPWSRCLFIERAVQLSNADREELLSS